MTVITRIVDQPRKDKTSASDILRGIVSAYGLTEYTASVTVTQDRITVSVTPTKARTEDVTP